MSVIRHPDDQDPRLPTAARGGRQIIDVDPSELLVEMQRAGRWCGCWRRAGTNQVVILCRQHEVESLERLFEVSAPSRQKPQ